MNDISKILSEIQKKIVVPKNRRNNFGNYNYRNCEDILEAIKKVLPDGAFVSLSDDIIMIGDRFYIKATATLCCEAQRVQVDAFARESLDKKGMDSAQITGSASSYARKYALNGLFAIDDSEDADSHDNSESNKSNSSKSQSQFITKDQEFEISKLLFDSKTDSNKFLAAYKVDTIAQMSIPAYEDAKKKLNNKIQQINKPANVEYLGV